MDGEAADPAALGFGGLALTTFIFSMVNAGIAPVESLGAAIPMGLFYGGLAQFAAGMWDIRRGGILGGTSFSSYGAFWMGFAAMSILQARGILPAVPATGMAVLFIAWGIFTTYMTVGAVRASKAATAVFAALTVLFFLLAGGEFNSAIRRMAGYEGIICTLAAWYTSAGTLINKMYGRELIPMGAAEE
ncbi:MAG: acetate uptake transporter [Candidatus Bathyarchaeia archaeon]|nr:acetate uptake transporter [Candidatus Bathyarchaeota archaeon]